MAAKLDLQYHAETAFGQYVPPPMGWARVVKLTSLFLGGTVLLLAMIGCVGVAMGPFFGWMSPVGIILAVVGATHTVRAIRRRRARTVLSYVEQAVRLNLPLPKILWAAQRSESRGTARRLFNVREAVEAGAPVAVALTMCVPEIPQRTLELARASERIGRLAPTLARLIKDEPQRPENQSSDGMFISVYPLMMFVFLTLMLTLFAVFVAPKLNQFFHDFGVKPPALMVTMLALSRFVLPAFAILVCAAFLVYLVLRLGEILLPTRGEVRWLQQVKQTIAWHTPAVGRLQRDGGLADVFETTADALDVGYPLDRALMDCADLQINHVLKQRLGLWLAGIQSGTPAHDAARAVGLPSVVSGMMATARTSDTLARVMRFLARYYRGRFSRMLSLLRGSVVPALVLFFGVLVALVALTLFLPMVELIKTVGGIERL